MPENEIQAKELILQAFRLLAESNSGTDLKVISLTNDGLSHSIEGEIMVDHRNKTIVANAQFRYHKLIKAASDPVTDAYIG